MASALVQSTPAELPPAPSTPDSSSTSVASSPTAILPKGVEAEAALGDALVVAVVSNNKKRKRKKKKSSAIIAEDTDESLAQQERKIGAADDLVSWRQRATARLDRLREVLAELETLRRDLSDAHDRASDAERAERLVNAGLRNAHALLADRDKSLAAANQQNASLSADIASLTEEKRKYEKRLVLLKTVCDEAKDARDTADKRADDASSNVASLKKEIGGLEVDLSKQGEQLASIKTELECLLSAHDAAVADGARKAASAQRDARIGAGVAAAAGIIAGFLLRGVGGPSDERSDD